MISLTILVENTARGAGVLGEHGLSYWLDTGTHRVLFDTGQGTALFHNARRLGYDLSITDAVVLSHGHYDHSGGLEKALTQASRATLFVHPEAMCSKYTGLNPTHGVSRRISTAFMESEAFRTEGRKVVTSRKPREIVKGVWATGEIPRTTPFEDTGGPFFRDKKLETPDMLLDDQALFFKTRKGVVVILGCAHSGVVNTLNYIRKLTGEMHLHALIGGLHLETASEERIEKTVTALKAFSPDLLGFCHCTGLEAMLRFWTEFPGKCFQAHAGLYREFED
jgi:7,8-dihydropterin-6-yl-methyl-4-(beta-D-ribofuranosyl)aminobenzene 5'-phosphate synthase